MEYDFMRHGDEGYTISISFPFFLEVKRGIVTSFCLLGV